MRKVVIILLIILCLVVSWHFVRNKNDNCYEVVKVLFADDFYVDFNRNNTFETFERIVFYDVFSKNSSLSQEDRARLNYLSKKYADEELLHKKVCLDDRKNIQDLKFYNGKNYIKELSEKGFVLEKDNKDKVLKNIEYTKSLDLVSLNTKSNKYHKVSCEHAFSKSDMVLVLKSELPKTATPCKHCFIEKIPETKDVFKEIETKFPREYFEKYSPVYKDKFLEFYITDYTKQYYPSTKCLTTASQSLLREINNAEKTIDFAIYGIDKQPEITKALINAKKRGVKIRWVYDVDKNGDTIYKESFSLKNHLTDSRDDSSLSNDGILPDGKKIKDSIMHNKFFIFDNKKVWTGSANISYTDLSGFNANSAVLVNSPVVANLYTLEFEKMFSGSFHQLKSSTAENIINLGSSKISVYFSPQDKSISRHILPLISGAKNYVYVPVFVITHKDFVQSLIDANNRGVDVRVVVDATSAASKNSSVKTLRDAGVKVKTENRAGKMHMKSIIIDDKYTVVGSMNFTKSGENYNDENVLIIENTELTKRFKNKFLYFYNDIPEKWLHKNPSAESFNSINSCFDGIDNDFDGKIDKEDEGCYIKK